MRAMLKYNTNNLWRRFTLLKTLFSYFACMVTSREKLIPTLFDEVTNSEMFTCDKKIKKVVK
jgi:hypothetical protein